MPPINSNVRIVIPQITANVAAQGNLKWGHNVNAVQVEVGGQTLNVEYGNVEKAYTQLTELNQSFTSYQALEQMISEEVSRANQAGVNEANAGSSLANVFGNNEIDPATLGMQANNATVAAQNISAAGKKDEVNKTGDPN
ncbi:hypothetical protein ACFL57_02295 [Candidatus Margulisiibacteriota bacterium]